MDYGSHTGEAQGVILRVALRRIFSDFEHSLGDCNRAGARRSGVSV
jgi:hypothetical protein